MPARRPARRGCQGAGKGPNIVGAEFDIGAQVDARESGRGLVAGRERFSLGRYRQCQHLDGRAERRGDFGRIIGAAIGDDDDLKVTGSAPGTSRSSRRPMTRLSLCAGMITVNTRWRIWTMEGPVVADTADVDPSAILGAGTRIWHLAQIREEAIVGSGLHCRARCLCRPWRRHRRQRKTAELRAGLRARAAGGRGLHRAGRSADQRHVPAFGGREREAQAGRRLARPGRGGARGRLHRGAGGGRRRSRDRPLGAGGGGRGGDERRP